MSRSLFAPIALVVVLSAGLYAVQPLEPLEVDARISPGQWNREAASERTLEAMSRLALDAAAAYRFVRRPSALSLQQSRLLEGSAVPAGPPVVGINLALGLEFSASDLAPDSIGSEPTPFLGGVARRTLGGGAALSWALESPQASGLRLRFSRFDLPPAARLYLYGFGGLAGEVHGPYTLTGPHETGRFWSHTVKGSVAFLELRLEDLRPETLDGLSFAIDRIAHMAGPNFFPASDDLPHGAPSDPCRIDAGCAAEQDLWPSIEPASRGVATLIVPSGSMQIAGNGALVADKVRDSFVPYLLTSNQLGVEADLENLEAVWRYSTVGCAGVPPSLDMLPRSLGAKVLARAGDAELNDFAFLRLAEPPPPGSIFFGWNRRRPPRGRRLYRLSTVAGLPMSFTVHRVVRPEFTCLSADAMELRRRRNYLFTVPEMGTVDDFGLGAPLLDAKMRIVGQFTGRCGINTADPCADPGSWHALDGRFDRTFKRIKLYINNSGPDLKFRSLTLSPRIQAPGETITATMEIRNDGGGPAEDFTVALWFDLGSQPVCGQGGATVVSPPFTLRPGGRMVWNAQFTAPSTLRAFTARALVDSQCAVAEKNEVNNARSASYRVANVPAAPYDLERFFPGTLGAMWSYKRGRKVRTYEVTSNQVVDEEQRFTIGRLGTADSITYAWRDDRLVVLEETGDALGEGVTLTYDPPLVLGDRFIDPGETFESSSFSTLFFQGFLVEVTVNRTVAYGSLVEVETPLQTFPFALELLDTARIRVRVVGFGSDRTTLRRRSWLVEDVGQVQFKNGKKKFSLTATNLGPAAQGLGRPRESIVSSPLAEDSLGGAILPSLGPIVMDVLMGQPRPPESSD